MKKDYTSIEVADILDKAADEVMIRGHCREKVMEYDGRVCINGAVALAVGVQEHHLLNMNSAKEPIYAAETEQFFNILWETKPNFEDHTLIHCWHVNDRYLDQDSCIEWLRSAAKHSREKVDNV